jgi:hypothetical protein
LKDKFETSTTLNIMTILITEVGCMKIEKESGMFNYMFRKAKETVKAKGVLSTPNHEPDEI